MRPAAPVLDKTFLGRSAAPGARAPWPRVAAGVARVAFGVALVLHGVAHAVLAARGAGSLERAAVARVVMHLLVVLAIGGFSAAGLGVLGARPFRSLARLLTYVAALASAAALLGFQDPDLAPGFALDVAAVLTIRFAGDLTVRFRSGRAASAAAPALSRPRRHGLARAGDALAVVLVLYVVVTAATRPWRNRWGVTPEEITRPMPGDRAGRHPAFDVMHAVTIDASPEDVWPWLVQLGQDRGGFYSYDALENLFGLDIHSAARVVPEWQELRQGDLVRAAPPGWMGGVFGQAGWRVDLVEPNRALVLRHWGAFVLEPMSDGRTRLIVRAKMSDPKHPVWAAALTFLVLDMPHFVMERKMLLGIRDRAEASAR